MFYGHFCFLSHVDVYVKVMFYFLNSVTNLVLMKEQREYI